MKQLATHSLTQHSHPLRGTVAGDDLCGCAEVDGGGIVLSRKAVRMRCLITMMRHSPLFAMHSGEQ